MKRKFKQVDVFTQVPFKGNPVAVVLEGSELSDAEMQQIASWTNLSETTFVLPPTEPNADYHVRIFTPRSELPFAGHPTLGTAHAVIQAGMVTPKSGTIVQQCAVGLVEISVMDDGLSFRLPRYAATPAAEPESIRAALGRPHLAGEIALLDVGPRWVVAELTEASAVELLAPDLDALAAYERRNGTTGITVFAKGGAADITVRTFAPADGVPEDPVCGSGNGAVAAYRLLAGAIGDGDSYTATQGRQVGRDGKIFVRIAGDAVHIGGSCVTCVDGVLTD